MTVPSKASVRASRLKRKQRPLLLKAPVIQLHPVHPRKRLLATSSCPSRFRPQIAAAAKLSAASMGPSRAQELANLQKGPAGQAQAAYDRAKAAAVLATTSAIAASSQMPVQSAAASGGLVDVWNQIRQDVGIIFLDRIRIRLVESVLGEELLSMSLAPGERVVLEQKSFSQRETTFEDENETDTEQDIQLDSSLTTALEVAMSQQQTQSTKTDMGASLGFNGASLGVPIDAKAQASNSVSDADTTSRTTAVKQSSTTSQQVTSKYRSVHKTTLTVSTEQQFTNTSQRTIQNPNRFTPIDLRYFKVYQKLQVCHERYGARLAWAPTVRQPGSSLLARAQAAFEQIISEAIAEVSMPTPPAAPPNLPTTTEASTPQNIGANWPDTGQSKNITLSIPPPAPVQGSSWTWDGDSTFVSNSLAQDSGFYHTNANPSVTLAGTISVDGSGNVVVPVHVAWAGGGYATIQASANFVANAQAEASYQQAMAAYNAQVAVLTSQAIAGATSDAESAKQQVVSSADILSECLMAMIAAIFPLWLQTSVDLLETCRAIFDWDSVAFTIYPGWWNGALIDPDFAIDSFVNAAGAKMYLAVRPGMELAALQLIALTGSSSFTSDPNTVISQLQIFVRPTLAVTMRWILEVTWKLLSQAPPAPITLHREMDRRPNVPNSPICSSA